MGANVSSVAHGLALDTPGDDCPTLSQRRDQHLHCLSSNRMHVHDVHLINLIDLIIVQLLFLYKLDVVDGVSRRAPIAKTLDLSLPPPPHTHLHTHTHTHTVPILIIARVHHHTDAAACAATIPPGLLGGPALSDASRASRASRRHRGDGVGATTEFFVDPKSGSDSNAGTLEAPFKTVQRAQAQVRTARAAGNLPIVVHLRGGTYFVGETITFGAEDSGSGADSAVLWAAYESEKPVWSGGVDLTGLHWTKPSGSSLAWTASAPPKAVRCTLAYSLALP
jgi:hypothetical protein